MASDCSRGSSRTVVCRATSGVAPLELAGRVRRHVIAMRPGPCERPRFYLSPVDPPVPQILPSLHPPIGYQPAEGAKRLRFLRPLRCSRAATHRHRAATAQPPHSYRTAATNVTGAVTATAATALPLPCRTAAACHCTATRCWLPVTTGFPPRAARRWLRRRRCRL